MWISIFTCVMLIHLSARAEECDDKSLDRSAYLDNDMKIYAQWATNKTHLTMKVTGQTKGWLGVGFSPSGVMIGADIVIGWIKDGKTILKDFHGRSDQNGRPILDKHQDYTLLNSMENDANTSYCFTRKLNTCDKEDYIITTGTTKMIYAYNDNDPTSENVADIPYHENNRGTTDQNLIGPVNKKPTGSDIKYHDFIMPNICIPDGRDTYYWCQFFKLPDDLNTKHHMIGYEPIFQKGHEKLMHHLLVYKCIGNNIAAILENSTGFECYTPAAPIPYLQCQTTALGWGVGSKGTFFPENVGFPFVNEINGSAVYYMFDIHYDNPQKKSGVCDSSGIRIYYTAKLRANDAGWLMNSFTLFDPYLLIPPKQNEFVVPAHCAKECLAAVMKETGITVFGYILHTHLLGRKVKVHHYRGTKELEPIAVNDHYDFSYQQDELMDVTVSVLSGDSITTECTYNSSSRDNATIGGESTREEMCVAFLMYYPVLPIGRCGSALNPDDVNNLIGIEELYTQSSPLDPLRIKKPSNLDNTTVAAYLAKYKFTADQSAKIKEKMKSSDKVPECTGTIGKIDTQGLKTVNYPNVTPYQAKDECKK